MKLEPTTDCAGEPVGNEDFVSYAQNGEDVVLWRALRNVKPGRYVDVGAAHPTEDSVTRAFYERGWSGINIEPVAAFHSALAADRTRDINLRVAAGAEEGTLHFYEVPGTGLSTASGVEAEVAASRGFAVVEVDVPERTLDSIFAEHLDAGEPIHFLKIDVEGHEKSVLSGLDLVTWRPWVIVVEATRPESTTSTRGEFESLVVSNGYQQVLFDGLNCFYLADEHDELREALSYPACPLDHFVLDRYLREITAVERYSADLGGRMQELDSKRIELSHAVNDRDWMLAAERLYARELADATASLTASVHELRQQNRKVRRRLNRAEKRVADLQSSRTWVYGTKLRRRALRALGPAAPKAIGLAQRAMTLRSGDRGGSTEPTSVGAAGRAAPRRPAEVPWRAELFTELHAAVTPAQLELGRERLAAHRLDSDKLLEERLDGGNDRVGQTLSEMWALVQLLSDDTAVGRKPGGSQVVIDARCLQDPAFSQRGIGRFARPVLAAAAGAAPDQTVLLVSRELPPLPADLASLGRQVSSLVGLQDDFDIFLQPSPMTASIAPLVPALDSKALKIAVVFDFIPAEAPETYLADEQERARFKCRLAALTRYDRLLCISHSTRDELAGYGLDPSRADVVWPGWLCESLTRLEPSLSDNEGRILIPGGDDPRKNLAGALQAVADLSSAGPSADTVVVGYGSSRAMVLATAAGVGMSRERLVVAPHVTDGELADIYSSSSIALCAATAEGLSLPPLEALARGLPVAASDIPAHRELLGSGEYLADPDEMAAAVRYVTRNRRAVFEQQLRQVTRHQHAVLEEVIAAAIGERDLTVAEAEAAPRRARRIAVSNKPSIGIATPWPPQASGVADYSGFTLPVLGELADVTIYSTFDPASVDRTVRRIHDATAMVASHDAFLNVLGNSHFHLPMLRVLLDAGGAALGHDTRMIDLYAHARGAAGAANVMSRSGIQFTTPDAQAAWDDPMSIKDLCYWEIAQTANPLILHSPSAAKRIHLETGVMPVTIPFIPDHVPDPAFLAQRQSVRESLAMTDGSLHLVVVGGIDTVTKRCDTIIEALGWLVQWGIDARLHLVGGGSQETVRFLTRAARFAGVGDRLHVTGRVDRSTYDRYLLAGDLGIQIRSSSVLSISGALVDTASFGMPALATEAMVTDMELPEFIRPLPTLLSPLMLAEAVTGWLDSRPNLNDIEVQRAAYVDDHTEMKYATSLLAALGFER